MKKSSQKDLSLLLLPISKKKPSGENVRYDSSYRQLQEMRVPKPGESVDFLSIEQLCETILTHSSKDLHVAAILTEAWIHLYGLQGLRWGLELILSLSESFWETIYPYSANDIEVRLSAFVWINEKLSDATLHTPITQPKIAGFLVYTLADLVDAHQHDLNIQKAGLKKHELIEFAEKNNKPTLSTIYKSMILTPVKVYEELLEGAKACEELIQKLEAFLEKKVKEDAIALSGFDDYLVQIQTYLHDAIEQVKNKDSLVKPDSVQQALREDTATDKLDLETMSPEELYDLLVNVAARLEEIDPKSAAPKLIRKAVRWGNMNSADFLQELAEENISLPELTKILN